MEPSEQDRERRLIALSSARGRLDAEQWRELYSIVHDTLSDSEWSELETLPHLGDMKKASAALIKSFFTVDIKRPAGTENLRYSPIYTGDLRQRFKRFLNSDQALKIRWRQLFQDIVGILQGYNFPEYTTLAVIGLSKQDLLSSFFADKIFLRFAEDKLARFSIDRPYLYRMYRNYLLDHLRRRHGEHPLPDDSRLPDSNDGATPAKPDVLLRYGLTSSLVKREAQAFLGAQGAWRHLGNDLDWIFPYLAEHHCAGSDSIPLCRVAKQYGIPSYHDRARKLGITYKKGGFPSVRDFEQTYLGQWIKSLLAPASITDEDQELVAIALDIMCAMALALRPGSHRGDADPDARGPNETAATGDGDV